MRMKLTICHEWPWRSLGGAVVRQFTGLHDVDVSARVVNSKAIDDLCPRSSKDATASQLGPVFTDPASDHLARAIEAHTEAATVGDIQAL